MDTSLFPTRTGARRLLTALLATGALAIAALPAQAQVPAIDFYVGGGLGQSNADVDDLQTPNFDDEDFAWKLFGGARILMPRGGPPAPGGPPPGACASAPALIVTIAPAAAASSNVLILLFIVIPPCG